MFWTIQMTHYIRMSLMQAMLHLDAFSTAYFLADICESLRCSFLQIGTYTSYFIVAFTSQGCASSPNNSLHFIDSLLI